MGRVAVIGKVGHVSGSELTNVSNAVPAAASLHFICDCSHCNQAAML
jgi:hypothetical protein